MSKVVKASKGPVTGPKTAVYAPLKGTGPTSSRGPIRSSERAITSPHTSGPAGRGTPPQSTKRNIRTTPQTTSN